MKLTVLTLLAALAVPFAFAQDSEKKPERPRGGELGERGGGDRGLAQRRGRMLQMITIFKAMDKDGNGELSAEEIEGATAALKSCDKNKDGKLTGEEIVAFRGRSGGARGSEGGRGRTGGNRPERPDRPKRPKRPDSDS